MEIRKMKIIRPAWLALVLLFSMTAPAQQPVKWSYSQKKISNRQYEIYITARLEAGWHLYSQNQPADAIGLPTKIRFSKNPLVAYKGSLMEKGKLKKIKEEILGTEEWLYEEEVSFIQLMEMKNRGKTNVNGTIEFQVCTNERCLYPATINFSISLNQ